ncbi:hypothetical protein [Chryseobacterium bernardetii]|uniref:hypothetical protein n=1 Tax=Chryseobacterium bernardetii TaxID=1241978 RepID=UPI00162400D1|nr:hypothetical protein [Chryseobacterium bernardetii]
MKTLEIELNKRLLIVEIEAGKSSEEVMSEYKGEKGNQWAFLCKGPDLTEDIVKGLVELHESTYYKDYLNNNSFFTLPSKSFISAIESSGSHWGENPVKRPVYNVINYGTLPGAYRKYVSDINEWQEAESHTFNPEKCIIFGIV